MTHAECQPARLGLAPLLAGFANGPFPALDISGLVHDSRRVRPGDLFVALAGHHVHGLSHAAQAIQQGAAAIIYDPAGGGNGLAQGVASMITLIPIESLSHTLGFIADRFYGEPSQSLTAIGITGTNGKTSCSHFLAQALTGEEVVSQEDFSSNHSPLTTRYFSAAVVGTLGWGKPGELRPTTHTTPDAIEIHDLLFQLRHEGFRCVAMEASSHGLAQGRLNGVRFKGALFTNFSRDHLDYHQTMAAYLEAKLKLLEWPGLEFVVFNADDPIAGPVMARMPAGVRSIGFGKAASDKCPLANHSPLATGHFLQTLEGVSFQAHFEGQSATVFAPVFGDFNVENLTATLSVLLAMGHGLDEAAALLRKVRAVPGRMESFTAAGRAVVVDYAHTPDALSSVLTTLRRHCSGRLWAVFGCGGDRDRGKRPEMGAIAAALADAVVLTDDNPRSEDGDAIIKDIRAGCQRGDLAIIRDRRDAIAFALERAAPDDLVLVAGKGHESTQEIQGQKYPFSDRAVVREILAQLGAAL
ncbi:UDP-N-acetylmuramoyl-L-alanyl-D-glutamate--2,6-diaminopimelate ligase [Methylomagnum sp.]